MRCSPDIRTYPLPGDERVRYVLSHDRGLNLHNSTVILLRLQKKNQLILVSNAFIWSN